MPTGASKRIGRNAGGWEWRERWFQKSELVTGFQESELVTERRSERIVWGYGRRAPRGSEGYDAGASRQARGEGARREPLFLAVRVEHAPMQECMCARVYVCVNAHTHT